MSPEPALVAARAALDDGNASDALASVDAWLVDHPDDPAALALRAEALLSLERWNEGLAATDELLAGGASEWAHRLRCVAFENLGRFDDAIESAQLALELAPYEANAYYLLAKGLWQSSRDDEAIVAFERAIALEPDVPLYRFGLASLVFEADPAKAEGLLRRIVRDEPDHAKALNDLGVLVERRGDLSGASGLYASALTAEPGLPVATENARRLERRRAVRTRAFLVARVLAGMCAALLAVVVVLLRTDHSTMAAAAAAAASLALVVLASGVVLALERRAARRDEAQRAVVNHEADAREGRAGVASWQARGR